METTTHVFRVKNMHCDSCAALIDETLRALPGVYKVHATVRAHDISVELDPSQTSPEAMITAITDLGFQMKMAPAALPPPVVADSVEPQVSDAAWALLEPLLRDRALRRSARTRDHRQLIEGIAYKHREGVQWREVPAIFGPWQTLYARWSRWRADGTWARVAAAARPAGLADELAWVESAG